MDAVINFIQQTGFSLLAENKSIAQSNRQEIIAAVCAVCAEDMGVDVNAIRVKSFKKL